ncbi:MAG: PhzF family phenazine biosynthesis protein [Actinomycetota bacterium]
MITIEYRHVDVFSRRAFQGNGLIVVLDAEQLSAGLMQAVTREMRQFESVFLTEVDLDARSATLRIFTEDEELDFAGHPVLGAASVLHGMLPMGQQDGQWGLRAGQRTIGVRTSSGAAWIDVEMDQGVPQFGPMVVGERAAALGEALGLTRDQLHRDLPMQVVSTGLDYLIVPVAAGLEQARICRPDFETLLQEVGAKFVYVLDPERPEGRTWDNAGRVEDVATGSAAGPAAGYLMRHQARPDDEPILLHQGQYTGRPSTIRVRTGPGGRLWVGGSVAPVAAGSFEAETV